MVVGGVCDGFGLNGCVYCDLFYLVLVYCFGFDCYFDCFLLYCRESVRLKVFDY